MFEDDLQDCTCLVRFVRLLIGPERVWALIPAMHYTLDIPVQQPLTQAQPLLEPLRLGPQPVPFAGEEHNVAWQARTLHVVGRKSGREVNVVQIDTAWRGEVRHVERLVKNRGSSLPGRRFVFRLSSRVAVQPQLG